MTDQSFNAFSELKQDHAGSWERFVAHRFVRQIAEGTLPEAAFRFYLMQDYVFLIHFARAWALAVVKAESLDDMRYAAGTVHGLIDHEMKMHVAFCAKWGIDQAEMERVEEAPQNMAYTRYVLERGFSGDFLDLVVALAPCVLGYGEIGRRLFDDSATVIDGNPYREWIELYGGQDYQSVAAAVTGLLDRQMHARLDDHPRENRRWPSLSRTFGEATRLEIGFWEMGIEAG